MLTTRMIFVMGYSKPNQALLNAARDKSKDTTEELEKALEQGADLNVTDIRIKNELNAIGFKYTPLMWAAYNGHLEKVKFLIKKGADINATTKHNNTALHIAAREGHTAVVTYLANLFPELLPKEGEKNRTPYEMAEAYGNWRKVVKVFKNNFSNPYFGPIKNGLAFEIALLISCFVDDPISLKNLSMVNKAWNELSKDMIYQNHYQESLKAFLDPSLKNCTWEKIYQHYYPNSPEPSDAFKEFIKKIHHFYMPGDSIGLLEDKSEGEKLVQGILALPFVLAHWSDTFPSSKKYRAISYAEINRNLESKLLLNSKVSTVGVFRELKVASDVEAAQAKDKNNLYGYLCKSRKPIYEINVDSGDALMMCKKSSVSLQLKVNSILSVNSWRMGKDYNSTAEEAEVHQLFRKCTLK